MGKLSKFFKSLIGVHTTAPPPDRSDPNKQSKRRWSTSDESRSVERRRRHSSSDCIGGRDRSEDPSKHAIAVAVATAAVVDAAVAAAQAAAEVVRMTATTGDGGRRELAAIKIQSCFRAFLARKALRALKALVKLQALVRGHILRKQTAEMIRLLHALTRAQGPLTPEKYQHFMGAKCIKNNHPTKIAKKNHSKSYTRSNEHDKIVEVDNEKPNITVRERNMFQLNHSYNQSQSLTTSRGSMVQPTSSSRYESCEGNSTEGSTRREPSATLKSVSSRSYISGYSDNPSYMSYTQSSRAKMRSLSAPRPRPLNEKNSINKNSVYEQWSDK